MKFCFIFLVKQQRSKDEVQYDADGVKIYSNRTMAPNGDTPSGRYIYGSTPPRININETADPGGNINATQKSNTILPPIVQKPSALPYISPMESALSSVFSKLSSPALDDAKNSKKKAHSSRGKNQRGRLPIPSRPRSSPAPPERKVKKNTWGAKPSKIAPLGKNTAGSDITSGSSFPSASMENSLDHPIRQPSINSDPTTDMVIEFLYESNKATDSGTNIAGSDLVPVSIFRETSLQMSDIPIFPGNRRRSTNYHPNTPRYSFDLSAPHGPNNRQKLPPLPAYPKLSSEPIIHQPSTSKLKKKK